MRFSNEIKAGIVILAGAALFVFFMFRTTSFQEEPYELKTYFKYAGDLKDNATVKLSGIEAGRLTSIKFVYEKETMVECILSINADAKVRKDAIAYIGTAGFVGDAYIGLTPGTDQEFLNPGDTLVSEDPMQMRELMGKAESIADDLGAVLKEVKELATNFNGVVTDNRSGLADIVMNLEGTTQNLEELSEDIQKHPWKLLFKGE